MQVMLRGPFDTYSGYGNDAVDMAIWMRRGGIDVIPYPTRLLPGLPREFLRLLEHRPPSRPDVALMFSPPDEITADRLAAYGTKTVGWSMWERSLLEPKDVAEKGYSDGEAWQPWSSWLDLMLVTCEMNVEAFRHVDPLLEPVVLPCGIDPDPERWPVMDRPTGQRPMTFLMVGMLAGRRDPFALLDAWREVKQEVPEFDAQLHLHTLAPGLHPRLVDVYPDVRLTERPLEHDGLLDLYRSADVLVSVSRGEGNNKPAMEFMATGGTVIASDWSGHQNWLHPDATYALPGSLQRCAGDTEAEEFIVDREALKRTLLDAWRHPAEVRSKGRVASKYVRQSLSWERVVRDLRRHLERL